MTRHLRPADEQPPLDGMPEPPPPEPTAGDLVEAWCLGYHAVRDRYPHPSVVKRVAGVCRTIGKECATLDDWRAAWRAAHVAGRQGRWDVVTTLVDELPSSLYVRPAAPTAQSALRDALQRGSIAGEVEQ